MTKIKNSFLFISKTERIIKTAKQLPLRSLYMLKVVNNTTSCVIDYLQHKFYTHNGDDIP